MLDDIRGLIDLTWEDAFSDIPKQKSDLVMELLDTVRTNFLALGSVLAGRRSAPSLAVARGAGRPPEPAENHEHATPRSRRGGSRERSRAGYAAPAPALASHAARPRGPGGGLYLYLTGGRYQSTDDAYTQAATVSISSNVAGRVLEVYVHDNEIVKRGEPLYRLDDAPFRIAVSDAEAQACQRRGCKSPRSSRPIGRSKWSSSRRETPSLMRSANSIATPGSSSSGIASQAQFDQARNALDLARQQVANAQQQIAVALANLGGDPDIAPERHPLVEQAQAALDRARLDLSYTLVKAPADGIVTKVEQLQVGDYIAASAPVFALVSTHDVWIEANFKEAQLDRMRPGQAATVEIDRHRGQALLGAE